MVFETGVPFIITYFVTLIFVFLGVYVGALLAFISPEELKPGKLYFKALENTLLVFIVVILLYSYGANILALILFGIAASIFLYHTTELTPINQISYFLLGIAFYFSTKTTDLFITIAALIFIYGLPLGSLYIARMPKKARRTALTDVLLNFGFFIIVAMMTNLVALYIGNI